MGCLSTPLGKLWKFIILSANFRNYPQTSKKKKTAKIFSGLFLDEIQKAMDILKKTRDGGGVHRE
jgi:hypothetical protein